MAPDPLKDKVVLITGASSGIGEATSRMMAPRGAKLALVARRREQLEALQREIAETGGEASVHVADVGDEEQAFAVTDQVIETSGRVDILINNAGIIRPGALSTSDPQDWRDTININLLAPMYMSKAVLRDMKPRESGHIVTISSNAARRPGSAGNNAYSASKYGVTGFSDALRIEVGKLGIRVTLVEPGTTETEVASSIADPAMRKAMEQHIGADHAMQASDIAAAICYAVSQHPRVNVDELWLTPTRQ